MPFSERRELRWAYLGQVAYPRAERLQADLRDRVRRDREADYLVLLEHPHVFTLGRNAERADILADDAWLQDHQTAVFDCDRGGRVTYHGPGQLVGYPIVDLSPDRRDLRRYVHDLQAILVRVLQTLGVTATARHRAAEIGVWVQDRKIASIGVHVSRWITTHGFALNLSTDLSFFSGIVPCGLSGVEMTSVEALTGERPDVRSVTEDLAADFAEVFERRSRRVEARMLLRS
jgi:lipoate-protein ligase B